MTELRDPRATINGTATSITGERSPTAAAGRRPGLVQIFPSPLDAAPAAWPFARSTAVIGRGRDVEVYIDDPSVSRHHARLTLREGVLYVTDLDSRHGTFVDGSGERALDRRVEYGGVIRVGRTLLMHVDDVVPYAAAPERVSGSFLGTGRDVIAGSKLRAVFGQARQVASLSCPVLILGESGSGKEAVARLIHAHGPRRKSSFVALNIAAIPEGMFESELFGHTKGAFTGAVESRLGAFREASGGVLFLDEVGDLRADLQPKLLRVIEQQKVRPLGAKDDVSIDTRVVAATSRDLLAATERGDFRLDLYYRLAGVVLSVPSLRERRDEIPLIASFVLSQEHPGLTLSTAAAALLVTAPWPGNVRQLQHALTQAAVRARASGSDRLLPEHFPLLPNLPPPEQPTRPPVINAEAIRDALRKADGKAAHAAKLLGISRATLYNVLKREGIDPASLREK